MRKILIFISLLSTICLFGQKVSVMNLPVYDQQTLHFGMALGYNSMDFTIHNSGIFYGLDSVYSVENVPKPGFNINIVSNLNLHRYLSFRVLPGLNFGQRNLEYIAHSRVDSSFFKKVMMIESTFLDIPFLLKYKSKRINNVRPYLIGGGAFKWDLAAQKSVRPEERPKIRLKPWDVYYTVGFGTDFFLMYFKFALEIKFEVGTRNILVSDNSQYSMAIERMNSKIIHVTALFEGSDIRSLSSIFKRKKGR
ncbi:MAG: porin family protein [Bacteroidota bacterium]